MENKLVKTLGIPISAVLIVQLMGCGTLLYPERRGQKAGNVDVGVALLDGIGLFFGIIPGVIAFAVDFSNGTIYLPGTARALSLRQVKFDPKHTTMAGIERIIKEETGLTVKLDDPNIKMAKLKSKDEMMVRFAENAQAQDSRLSLLR